MTKDELIRLAERIAGDMKRAGLPPAYMEGVIVDDAVEESYLDVFDLASDAWLGRLYSEADYDELLQAARSIRLPTVCLN